MPRIYQDMDLTEAQADMAIAAAKNDMPPAIDTQKILQPNGLFTAICTYPDVAAGQSQDGAANPAGNGAQPAPKPAVAQPPQPAANPAAAPPAQPGAAKTNPNPAVPPKAAPPAAQAQPAAPANPNGQPSITLGMLQRLWPHAAADVIQGIANTAPNVFTAKGINTPLRVAHFMAQISEECGAGTEMVENLNYSAQRLMAVWPRRFPNLASAQPYAHNPQALGDKVYNGRMGNQLGTDDGYNFRGRGCLQLTGRSSYDEIGQLCNLDLVNKPNLAVDPSSALLVAATEFEKAGCLTWCDQDSVIEVSALINLGHLTSNPNSIIGFASREAWLTTWKGELGL
jgi:putative chitinase